jgi:hypothetical protein
MNLRTFAPTYLDWNGRIAIQFGTVGVANGNARSISMGGLQVAEMSAYNAKANGSGRQQN